MATQDQGAVIEQGRCVVARAGEPLRRQVVPGLVGRDLEARRCAFQANPDVAGGPAPRDLHATGFKAPVRHRLVDPLTVPIVADGCEQERPGAEGLQVPGHVQRCAAEHGPAVRQMVKQHLTDEEGAQCLSGREHGEASVADAPSRLA